ncbi:MAG TPA: glycosyltransferase family 2 protein [Caldimonas sp.]|nr:glycosyltransferase family 2 protein [Caldimonas sp.]
MTSPPLVSFCIPTYNRCRYLASLLESLAVQLADFPFSFELVVADNASTDATAATIAAYADRLPIRALRHASNIGGYGNWQYVLAQAAGRYVVYVADDDSILGPQVYNAIVKMEADPTLAVVYAPWVLFDLVAQRSQGQFFSVPHDLRVERNAHGQLLDHILRHHIFPEIQIVRRDVLQATMPRVNEHAFFAFVHAAEYLTQGAILIQREPFYVSITRYFEDDVREQLGNSEVEHAWDRYRGGLEYMIARTGATIGAEERFGLHARIQQMIAARMAVAIRLRHANKRDPIDTYHLAMRLRGLGYESLLPVPLATLACEAMLAFVMRDSELHRGVRQMICIGTSDRGERDYFTREARVPVEFVPDMERCAHLSDALLFVRDDAVKAQALDSVAAAPRNVRIVRERDVAARFGL